MLSAALPLSAACRRCFLQPESAMNASPDGSCARLPGSFCPPPTMASLSFVTGTEPTMYTLLLCSSSSPIRFTKRWFVLNPGLYRRIKSIVTCFFMVFYKGHHQIQEPHSLIKCEPQSCVRQPVPLRLWAHVTQFDLCLHVCHHLLIT